jgi:hypothetical protein
MEPNEPNSIIYSLVGFGDKPLAAYSEYKGTFQKTCQNYLHSIEANSSGGYRIDDYCIFYINENGITYLIMTDLKYSKSSALSCLESIKKEFLSSFADKDLESLQEFELDKEFKPKLKMKYEYYNENKEVADESIQKIKDELFKIKDDVLNVSDLLNVRGDKAVEVNKANNLAERSYKYKAAAKKTNEKKKIFYIIAIILILLIIGYIISVFVCHSFLFDCSSD